MKEVLLVMLSQYGWVLVASLVASVAVAAVYLLPLVYQGFQYLKTLTAKNLGEKVSGRINDALDKLYNVIKHLIESESSLIREEILKAVADGKIDDAEIKGIRVSIAKKALEIISPEVDTIKRYMTGEAILDYVVAVVSSRMIKYAQELAAKKLQGSSGVTSSVTTP